MCKIFLLGILAPFFLFGEIKAVVFSFGTGGSAANWDAVGAWAAHLMDLPKEEADTLVQKRDVFLSLGGDEGFFWENYQTTLDAKIHPMWIPMRLPTENPGDHLWDPYYQKKFFGSMHNVPEMIGIVAALQKGGYKTPLVCKQEFNPYTIVLSLGSYGPVIPLYAVQGYENVLTAFKLSLSEAVLVDACPANIEAARSAGGDGIVFENPKQLKEELQQRGIAL